MMNLSVSRKIIHVISILGLFFSFASVVYFIHLGVFKDIHALEGLVGNSVILGPLLFIVIQIIQVIIPIIPGGISSAAGVLIFGPIAGFIYNYLGICIGSVIIFLLGRHYGRNLILSLISEKTYRKYAKWLENEQRFTRLFALAIFLPVAPDDALCLIAGLSKMRLYQFVLIIFLAKPVSIFLYSLLLIYGGSFLNDLFSLL